MKRIPLPEGYDLYYIAPEFRRKGYAAPGLRVLLDEIRNIVSEDEFYLRVNRDNPPPLRLMLNNGGDIHHEDEDIIRTYDFLSAAL